MRKFLLLILLAALVVVPTLAQEEGEPSRTGLRPDAPPYAIRGPHPVGFMTFDDGNAERPITGVIWYPAIQPEGVEEVYSYDIGVGDIAPSELNILEGHAILNAEPDLTAGPFPLVISSHGLGSSPYAMTYLHEHLASHGFVVIGMRHPGNTFRDNLLVQSDEMFAAFQEAAIDSMVLRPLDISQTLDYAEVLAGPDGDMAGVIDMEQVSVVGYSFGGYTALAAAGGQLDLSEMPEICASGTYRSIIPTWMCMLHADDMAALETHLVEIAGIEAEPGQMWPSFADERIDAIVPLAPGGGSVVISDVGYANIQVPMLLVRPSNDTSAIPEYNVNRAWEYSGSMEKILVTLELGEHIIINQCPTYLQAPFCFDPVWDMDRAHDLVNHFTTAFLLAELYGDEDARAALAPDAVAFPGIGYEAFGF